MKKKIILIGGGLANLSLSHALFQQGHEVVLLEGSDGLGGRFRGDAAELGFIPATAESIAVLEWLRTLTPFEWMEIEAAPLLFEHSEWRPFVGFGDYPSAVVTELSHLNCSRFLSLEPGLHQVAKQLAETLPFSARLRSEVTGFELSGGKITAALLNGQDRVAGDEFVFSPSPSQLVKLLPDDSIKPAHRSKLARQQSWTVATMVLGHKEPVQTETSIRFVLGTGKEFEPVVGRVWPTRSVWTILIAGERAEDLEHTGDCVRYIKRTLKRVWPELVDQAAFESIRVGLQSYGRADLKLKDAAFPELQNLKLADGRLAAVWGELSAAAMGHELSTLFVAQPQNPMLTHSEAVQSI